MGGGGQEGGEAAGGLACAACEEDCHGLGEGEEGGCWIGMAADVTVVSGEARNGRFFVWTESSRDRSHLGL